MKPLPSFFKPLFWDTDYRKVAPGFRKKYIIERILAIGRPNHIRWLFKTYPRRSILSVVRSSRAIDPKSRNFWLTYLKGSYASRRSR